MTYLYFEGSAAQTNDKEKLPVLVCYRLRENVNGPLETHPYMCLNVLLHFNHCVGTIWEYCAYLKIIVMDYTTHIRIYVIELM